MKREFNKNSPHFNFKKCGLFLYKYVNTLSGFYMLVFMVSKVMLYILFIDHQLKLIITKLGELFLISKLDGVFKLIPTSHYGYIS